MDRYRDEIRVETWSQLNDLVFERAWNPELGRFRPSYAFRGAGDESDAIECGLSALGPSFAEVERHLLRNFRKYAGRAAVADDTVWNWMTVGQHHGLPTRLVDWTFSPYVALHFATQNPRLYGRDAAITCADYARAHELLPDSVRRLLEEEGADLFTVDQLAAAFPTLDDFDAAVDEPFLLFFEPPSVDQRIVNQAALFSVMSSASASADAWLAEHPEVVFRIVIPASLKPEVRDKLDQANINERLLFPGLDGLTRWLRRYYGPRPERARVLQHAARDGAP